MCSIEAHEREHPTVNDDSSGGVILLVFNSKKYVLVSLGLTLNFIESWIKSIKASYLRQTTIYFE